MVFLDFLICVLGVYLVTQIFLPMVFPNDFQRNWLFKKDKPKVESKKDEPVKGKKLSHQIKALTDEKQAFEEKAKTVVAQTAAELEEAQRINDAAKNLTK